MKLDWSKGIGHAQKALDFIIFVVCDTLSFGVAALLLARLKQWVHFLFPPESSAIEHTLLIFHLPESDLIRLIQFVGSVVILFNYALRLIIHSLKMVWFELGAKRYA